MREDIIPQNLEEIKPFINGLRPMPAPSPTPAPDRIPANDDDPDAVAPDPATPPAPDKKQNSDADVDHVAVKGNNNVVATRGSTIKTVKHIHPAWVIVGVLIFAVDAFMRTPIDSGTAKIYAAKVAAVAQCEGVSSHKIHNEMKKEVNYKSYLDMNHYAYYRAIFKLGSRKCG